MNDNHIEELIPRYLDDDLSDDERSMVAEHLASCAECRSSLETFTALEKSLVELGAAVPSWKTAKARFGRRFGFGKRRSLASLVFNVPVLLGLSFVALGVVLFLRGKLILLSLGSLGPRLSAPLAGFQGVFSRWFAAAAGTDTAVLLWIYGLLTLALLYAGREIVVNFGRK
ncbi:MAG: zf-HC2 domain-containing protein [Candidatus Krumholzibacteriaceae bacterium]|jgi:anti-sigma factor RsiW